MRTVNGQTQNYISPKLRGDISQICIRHIKYFSKLNICYYAIFNKPIFYVNLAIKDINLFHPKVLLIAFVDILSSSHLTLH